MGQISISAFVVAAKDAALAAGFGHIQLFEFEDEALKDFEPNDDAELQMPGVWTPADSVSKEVHELVSMMPADFSPLAVAAALSGAGHGVVLRQGLGSRHLQYAASTLRNEFVVLQSAGGMSSSGDLLELIIEPRFRARFELPSGGTALYHAMLAALPRVFVGPVRQLSTLVQYAARVLAREYKLAGRDVPPWRTPSALLSLWLPERVREWSPDGASPPPSPFSGVSPSGSTEGSPVGSPETVLPYCPGGWPLVTLTKGKAVKTVYGFGGVSAASAPAGAKGAPDAIAGKVVAVEEEEREGGSWMMMSLVGRGETMSGGGLPRVHKVKVHPQWLM